MCLFSRWADSSASGCRILPFRYSHEGGPGTPAKQDNFHHSHRANQFRAYNLHYVKITPQIEMRRWCSIRTIEMPLLQSDYNPCLLPLHWIKLFNTNFYISGYIMEERFQVGLLIDAHNRDNHISEKWVVVILITLNIWISEISEKWHWENNYCVIFKIKSVSLWL